MLHSENMASLIWRGFSGIGLMMFSLVSQAQLTDVAQYSRGTVSIASDSATSGLSRVTIAANPELKGNGFKRFMIGKNYRNEWTQPINIPILNLSSSHLKPTKEGGGKQTRSLKVEDENGNEYSLRSIRKYPEKAVPAELKNSIAEKIVTDGISASYPYAALSLPVLARAAGVPYLQRKLVYIGDDPGLGEFRSKYKNTMALYEDARPRGHLPESIVSKEKIETHDTEELIFKLQESGKNKVDQVSLLKARLLDNFVMDFDRHEGQWKWVSYDSGDCKIYIAIPKDGDQVFFTNKGVIPALAKGPIPEIQGFKAKAKDPVTFNRSAINFDNYFLNGLNENQWREAIESFLQSMTDSVIEKALLQQPHEIQQYSAKKIVKTLKKKRKSFMKQMMNYYAHLSKEVSVHGSNEAETFQVLNGDDGRVLVTVTGEGGNGIYERVFDPKYTKEIRLYGLEGNDHFQIEGEKSPIKIRIIGGPGQDQFVNNANYGKLWVYDVDVEGNTVSGNHSVKNEISGDPMNNEYERLGYIFNKKGFGLYSECGFDGGVYFGLRYRIINQGFRKEPYASKHDISIGRTIAVKSFLFRYNADLIKAFGNTDLLIRSEYFTPTARTNFFGLGNETVFDESKGIKYYRARYDIANVSVLARNHIKPWIDVSYGPTFQYFQLKRDDNEGKYITNVDHTATDDNELHNSYMYAGGELQFNVNTKNDLMLPSRGVLVNATARSLFSMNGNAGNMTQLKSTVSFYSDFLAKDHLIFATRFGFAHNIGDFQYAQANYLGFRENLRGFRIHRFAGRTSAYNNLELRWKMTELKTFLCPIAFGLVAFNDVGRVWADNENSSTWHNGCGGGIWIAPINRIVFTGTLSYSNEEKNLPWITIGFQF